MKVLNHHLGLLRDVVRVELEEARQGLCRLLAFDIGIVLTGLQQFEIGRISRVVLQHVEDELLLDCLTHRVTMEWITVPPEDRKRLVLGRCRKGEEAQVRLPPTLGHAAEELLHILQTFLNGLPLRRFSQRLLRPVLL